MLILPFSEIRAADLPLVGGKGANLGELANAGFPIPDGFCLTVEAFQHFMDTCPDQEGIYAELDALETNDVTATRQAGDRIRRTLLDVAIPNAVAAATRQAWQALGTRRAFAVRSSATAEDLPDASFAGQQDTYLNVTGEAPLLDAVRRCWVSLFTDRAILYRARNGFPHRDVQLAVVVQRMIRADASGILFTADPLTGHRHTLTIDAGYGLGEALVGGLVTPDAYRVDKRTRTILERRIAEKQVAILPAQDGGTRQVTLSDAQRGRPVLTDAQVLALADLGARVEAHYGAPQDIEWAIAGGKAALLQARPITSLYPIDGLQSPDGSLRVFFSLGHQQSMTRALAPLSLSTVQVLMPIGHGESATESTAIRAGGGRMYVDLTQPLRHPVLRRVLLRLLGQLDALAPEAAIQAMRHPAFRGPHGLRLSASALRSALGIARRVWLALWRRDLTGFVDRTNALMDDYIADTAAALGSLPPGRAQLQAVVEALPDVFPFFLNWVPEAGAGMAATRLLARLAQPTLPSGELEALTLGIPGNVVAEMNWAIGDLVDLVCLHPQLAELFGHLGDDGHAWLERAAQLPDSGAFMAAWDDFLSRYGARGPSEIDLHRPRWYEAPLTVLRVIAGYVHGNRGCHQALSQSLVEAREAAHEHLLAAARTGPLGRLRVRVMDRLYHAMSEVGGMREHHKFLVVRLLAVVKEILKANAAALTAAGRLTDPDDIWFLTWGELLTMWDADADWRGLIAGRRADLARYERLSPPLIITSEGEAPQVSFQVAGAPDGALLGNPVAPGVVEGVVRVIRDPQRETLAAGEILVTEFTDPGWTPLFINAGGLILEVGGALTHGAVVAREYGIPAVVGVREATAKLTTGQHVRLDGNRGIVEVL